MQQPRRASAASPPPPGSSTHFSSIPRPTVMTSGIDNSPMSTSQPNNLSSPLASTPDALTFYGQRQQQSSAVVSPTAPPGSGNSDRPSFRSASGPSLNTSRSNPTVAGPERLQRTSIKDLVAKFNQNGDGPPSQTNPIPRKPTPTSSAGAQEPGHALRKKPSPRASTDSIPRKPRRSPAAQNPYRAPPPTSDVPRLNTQVPTVGPARPRTADNSASAEEPSRQPLFGEVIPGNRNAWANLGHGIPSPQSRSRRVSEGSMHYPNAMFPEGRSSYIGDSPVLDDSIHAETAANAGLSRPSHKRSRSDFSRPQQIGPQQINPPSRIPVKGSRVEGTPDLVTSSTNDSTPRQPTTPTASPPARSYEPGPPHAAGSSQRLNAIISAPAPKVSPPLRSSRPRQDVTAARSGSPTPGQDRVPPMVSPEKKKLFAGVDMDLATRRNSIRKALRDDRERNKQQPSPTSPRFFGRPTNGSVLSPNQSPTSARGQLPRDVPPSAAPPPQLSNAVYSKPTPALKLNVQGMPTEPADDPGSGATQTTQFEEDDSPILRDSGSYSNDVNGPSYDPRFNESLENNQSGSHGVAPRYPEQGARPSRTVLSQIMEMRRSDAGRIDSVAGSSPRDQDDAGTIQIMLSDTPALNRTSAGWQNRDYHYDSSRSLDTPGGTPQSYNGVQDDSTTSTPSFRTRTSHNGKDWSSPNPDRDPYHLINRILDQYRESGVVSPEMVHDFQQHILEVDPELSARGDAESMSIARAALEDIIRDHSQSASVTPHSTADSFPSGQSEGDRPHWDSVSSDVTVTTTGGAGSSRMLDAPASGEGGPMPPPKDLTYRDFSSSAVEPATIDAMNAEDSQAEGRPLLPEMPSTDGHLGLIAGTSVNSQAPASPSRAPPNIPQAPDTDLTEAHPAQRQLMPQLASTQQTLSGPQYLASHSREPSVDKDATSSSNSTAPASEQRRLTQRRHLIKELIDTEYSFNQDMKVIEDIYKGTASSVTSLTQEDQRVLFGNSAQVVEFSESFLDALKQASRSVYKMPRAAQFRLNSGANESNSESQTEESSLASSESTDDEKDRKTFIGDAFNNYSSRMEKVYSEYLKNHDFANQRLQKLQAIPQVQLWLSECHAYANDITSAWDLDSLLVKPVQRILKYPLLLRSLLEQTPDDHPDHGALEIAVKQSEDVSHRINESKKRAELLEQVVNKNAKRKDFDFSKVFSRRTDKIAHRVGLSEAVEDPEYKRLAEKFGGRYFQLQIVMRDIEQYKKKTEDFMNQFNRYIGAIEELVDVGHSNSPEIESKWRKFAVTIREMTAIAYADHDIAVRKHCIDPILTLIKLHDGPQRLMQKRKKRIVEYAKYVTVKNRGDRVDKKLQEQGDQFVALNDTLKDELPKLFNLTAKLVDACLRNFVDLQFQWQTTWEKKIKHVLEDQQIPKEWEDIVEAFNSDFSYTEAHVLSLGICNGSLLAETSNFLSSASSFTMTDDGSSTKRPSMGPTSKASPSSGHGDYKRGSGTSTGNPFASPRTSSDSHGHQANGHAQYQPRYRADSNLSSSSTNAWNQSSRFPPYNPAAYGNQQQQSQASRYRSSSEVPPQAPPTSVPVRQSSNAGRPLSSSTFYSAASTAMPASQHQDFASSSSSSFHEPRYSGLFSSAMPMSDSPQDVRRPGSPDVPTGQTEPNVLFTAASMFDFNLENSRKEAGYPYLNYNAGEIFNVIGQKGELWLATNQDDPANTVGWIWEKHFAKLVTDEEEVMAS